MKIGDKVKTSFGHYGVISDVFYKVEKESGEITSYHEDDLSNYEGSLFNIGDEVALPPCRIVTVNKILPNDEILIRYNHGGCRCVPRDRIRLLKDLVEKYRIIVKRYNTGDWSDLWEAYDGKEKFRTSGHNSKNQAIAALIKMIENPEEKPKNKLTPKESAALLKFVDAMEETLPLFTSYGKRGDWDMFDDAN